MKLVRQNAAKLAMEMNFVYRRNDSYFASKKYAFGNAQLASSMQRQSEMIKIYRYCITRGF